MYTHTQNFFKCYTETLQTIVNKTMSLNHAGQQNSQNLKLCHTSLLLRFKGNGMETYSRRPHSMFDSFCHSSSSLLPEIQFTEQGNLQLHFYQET